MIRNNTTIMLVMVLSVSLLSCERESSPTAPGTAERLSSTDAQVVANCLTVQAALEEFAFYNWTLYPYDELDATYTGESIQDLLPRYLLENPVTLYSTEPSAWERSAIVPGETGVEFVHAHGLPVGYTISGVGEELGVNITTITNIASSDEAKIKAQVYFLEAKALGRFMRDNDDAYPLDVDSDRNHEGKTLHDYLIDYYWGNNIVIPNVFTGELTEPRNGTAYEPGSIAYSPVIEEDVVIGCIFTAAGESPGELIVNRKGVSGAESYVHMNCRLLEDAVLEFAWRNNMVFPNDLTTDTDLTGKTVSDSKQYREIYNAYTDVGLPSDLRSKPIVGTAYAQGEIAYTPVSENGANSGYEITGVGKYPGVIVARHEYALSKADKAIYKTGALLRTAAEEFIERNNGVIAVDFNTDMNLDSQTIFDLLPSSRILSNPTPSKRTGIVNGRAVYPGETGYAGWETGFRITSINDAGYYIVDYVWRSE